MARIMAIDYGIKRTGIATTDALQIIASPLDTVETTQLFLFFEEYLNYIALIGVFFIVLSGIISIPGQMKQVNEQ